MLCGNHLFWRGSIKLGLMNMTPFRIPDLGRARPSRGCWRERERIWGQHFQFFGFEKAQAFATGSLSVGPHPITNGWMCPPGSWHEAGGREASRAASWAQRLAAELRFGAEKRRGRMGRMGLGRALLRATDLVMIWSLLTPRILLFSRRLQEKSSSSGRWT